METLPYYLLLASAGIPALVGGRTVNTLAWRVVMAFYIVMIGLRHHVGMDWNNYLHITRRTTNQTLWYALSSVEPGFGLLTWLSVEAGWGVYGANLVGAAIFCWGLFRLCRQAARPWIALTVATPFLVIVVAMSANRQSIAIGILMAALARWDASSLIRRIIYVLAATAFHASAAFFLLIVVLVEKMPLARKTIILVVLSAISYFVLVRQGSLAYYTSVYLFEQSYVVISGGAIQHVALNAIPGLILLMFRRRLTPLVPSAQVVQVLAAAAVLLVPLTLVASVAAGRSSLYLFAVSCLTWPAVTAVSPRAERLTRVVIVLGCSVLLWSWLTYSNSRIAHVPYSNALFLSGDQLQY
jgi:hypothetical protein